MTSSVTDTTGSSVENGQQSKSLAVGVWLTLLTFSFWTSGVVFGWPALVLILNDEGIYADLCDNGRLDCESRQGHLTLVFSAGFFCLLAGRLLWGLLLDRAGPRATSFLAALCIAIGASMFALSMKDAALELYIPAYALIGFGGPGIHLANFHTSNLFPAMKRTVTASYSGIFGTSGLVFVIFRAAYNAGLRPELIWLVYASLTMCIAVGYLLVQPNKTLKVGDGFARGRCCSLAITTSNKAGGASQANSKKLSIRSAVLQWKMQALGIFFGISFLHLQFYLGQAEDILGKLGDKDHNNAYLLTFNIIGSSALALFLPVGRFLDTFSFDAAFFVCNTLAILFNAVSLLDSLPLQVVGFVCWCVSRMILFASFFSFIPATVGFPRFGVTSGVLSTVSALIGLLNIPLSKIAQQDSHKPVMLGFLAALLVLYSFPALLRWDRLRAAALMQQESQADKPKAGVEEAIDAAQVDAKLSV